MRLLAGGAVIVFSLLNIRCDDGIFIQPPQQGEWSNFHNDKDQVSMDARPSAEKPEAPEK